MTAYWINMFREIRDADRLARYAALAGDVMTAHGGRFLARGLPQHALEFGVLERTTLIEFPSVEAAFAAYHSDEYQQALAVLGDAANRDIRIIEAER